MRNYKRIKYTAILLIYLTLASVVSAQQKRTIFDNVQLEVDPVYSINTDASEISPAFVKDAIFFTGVPDKYLDKSEKGKNKTFYSIFSAEIDSNGLVTTTRRSVLGFGNDFHEGPAAYCEKTGELFVTVSDVFNSDTIAKHTAGKRVRLGLIIMKFFDGRWQEVRELPFNDPRFHFAHPAISTTGDTLIFSSDYNTLNYGNTDLFMSIREKDKWSAPVNLGNYINTSGNEMFPTFINGGLLSFASDGRTKNEGGLDIYYTSFPDSGEVKTLGNLVNSEFDDFGLIVYKNEEIGYFTSNRNPNRKDDIYELKIKKLFEVADGKVINERTNEPVSNASLVFKNCNDSIIKETFTDSTGNFSVELPNNNCFIISASKEGYENKIKNFSTFSNLEIRLKQNQYYEILALDYDSLTPTQGVTIKCNDDDEMTTNDRGIVNIKLPLPKDCELKIEKEGYLNLSLKVDTIFRKVITRDTVYLYKKEANKAYLLTSNYSKWSIVRDLQNDLNRLINIMNLNPDITVELGFHTDSRGGDAYNEWLSQKHAEIAANYIIENGIDQSRIVAKGYGESQLINRCANGVDCTDEEHEQNRRIEFKILQINPL